MREENSAGNTKEEQREIDKWNRKDSAKPRRDPYTQNENHSWNNQRPSEKATEDAFPDRGDE